MASLFDRFGAVSDAISSGAFDPVGSNYTDFLGKTNVPKFTGATVSTDSPTIAGVTLPKPDLGSGADAPASNAGAGAAGANGIGPFIGSYFIRGVVIVLGFVFVAVGLTMFKPQAVLQR